MRNPNALALFMRMHILVSHTDKYAKDNFSLLRSKICELYPVHRASLEALLQHLLLVASHSDKNGMTVETLSSHLCGYILGFNTVTADGIHVKARHIDLS